MLKHKRPLDQTESIFIAKALIDNPVDKSKPILDLGCGFGRNSMYLSKVGYDVISADIDSDVFESNWHNGYRVSPVIFDASKSYPFKQGEFAAVVCSHFYIFNMVVQISQLIADNGLLIIETFSGHGGNWLELPLKGELHENLISRFSIESYNEKAVGPNRDRASVRLIARKCNH